MAKASKGELPLEIWQMILEKVPRSWWQHFNDGAHQWGINAVCKEWNAWVRTAQQVEKLIVIASAGQAGHGARFITGKAELSEDMCTLNIQLLPFGSDKSLGTVHWATTCQL